MSVVNHLQVAKLNVWPINGSKLFEPFFLFHSLTFMQVPYFCQLCSPSTLPSRQLNSMWKHLLEQFWHFKRTALIIHVNKLLSISAVLTVWGRWRETFGAINWILFRLSQRSKLKATPGHASGQTQCKRYAYYASDLRLFACWSMYDAGKRYFQSSEKSCWNLLHTLILNETKETFNNSTINQRNAR